jgi:hypothetical protein
MPCYRFHGDQMTPHVVELNGYVSDAKIEEMSAWCTSEENGTTGWYNFHRRRIERPRRDTLVEFRFSNLATAILFKMTFC